MTERVSKETVEGLRESVTVLERAAGYVERGWTQGRMAEDAAGMPVEPDDPSACKWCMYGAMLAAFERLGVDGGEPRAERVRNRALYAVATACCGRELLLRGYWLSRTVVTWNELEATSGAEVAEKLREAARLVRGGSE